VKVVPINWAFQLNRVETPLLGRLGAGDASNADLFGT
jgi:hypothetical protein